MLHEALASAQSRLDAANRLEDINERRRQSAVWLRDVRHYSERIRMVELITPSASPDVVGFGHAVPTLRSDGRRLSFIIVGEDVADPSLDSLSLGRPGPTALSG